MAGTVVTTEITHTSVKKITFAWTSASDGKADATTTATFDGEIIAVVQEPSLGASQPTDNYDVTITDSGSVDVLGGLGADLSNAADTIKTKTGGDDLLAVSGSSLTLAVRNAGDAKVGSTVVYIR